MKILFIACILSFLSCSDKRGISKEVLSLDEVIRFNELEYNNTLSKRVFDIRYKTLGEEVEGFVVLPKKFDYNKKYPLMTFNRGGNDKLGVMKRPSDFFDKLSLDKYVIIMSQYRGAGGSTGKDEFGGRDVDDVINLIKIARKLSFVDDKKLYSLGISRGGIMNYRLMSEGIVFNSVVSWAGPTDMFLSVKSRPEIESKVFSRLIPSYQTKKDLELKKRSVIHWPQKVNSPLLLLHGNIDWRVSVEHSMSLSKELKKLKKKHKLKIFNNGTHSLRRYEEQALKEIHEWFRLY